MAYFLCKLTDDQGDLYFEWSTIVDAPATYALTREELRAYRAQYGKDCNIDFDERMARVDQKGTSALHYRSVDELIAHNRAGPGQTHLSKQELIRYLRAGFRK